MKASTDGPVTRSPSSSCQCPHAQNGKGGPKGMGSHSGNVSSASKSWEQTEETPGNRAASGLLPLPACHGS